MKINTQISILNIFFLSTIIIAFLACNNDMSEINDLVDGASESMEVIENVTMLYSDSAIVKVRITAPLMHRKVSRTTPTEEFPNGIRVEFLNKQKRTTSWLEADYAQRERITKKIYLKRNVKMENSKGDRIYSSELIWDENEEILETEKFVRIIQPEQQDTTEGFGFKTNQEFTRFEIKNKGAASLNAKLLEKELLNKEE